MNDSAPTILVVDDHGPNLELLADILGLEGHAVLTAVDGKEALERVATADPDLVLLDVNMPGVNGLEVCRQIRADPKTAAIPIILVTSLTHREHRLEGIAAGANDYLTKPVDRTDLLLRVRNALSLRRLHRERDRQYQQLQRLERLRDDLVHMLVHDLRGPLTGISATLELLGMDLPEGAPPEFAHDIEAMQRSARQMAGMVATVLDVSRLEANAMPIAVEPTDANVVAGEAIDSLVGPGARVPVRLVPTPHPAIAIMDAGIVRRIIGNLVQNAVKFSPPHGEVVVEVVQEPRRVRVQVIDSGPGVSPEHQAVIFEKFGQIAHPRGVLPHSTGLGLTFCKLAVEAHSGAIGVESAEGQGSLFWFTLPGLPAVAAA